MWAWSRVWYRARHITGGPKGPLEGVVIIKQWVRVNTQAGMGTHNRTNSSSRWMASLSANPTWIWLDQVDLVLEDKVDKWELQVVEQWGSQAWVGLQAAELTMQVTRHRRIRFSQCSKWKTGKWRMARIASKELIGLKKYRIILDLRVACKHPQTIMAVPVRSIQITVWLGVTTVRQTSTSTMVQDLVGVPLTTSPLIWWISKCIRHLSVYSLSSNLKSSINMLRPSPVLGVRDSVALARATKVPRIPR